MKARKIKPTICRFHKKNSNKNLEIRKRMVKIGWVKIIFDKNV
jgi:hypothetical protein